ncbi:MAG: tRNA (adenosine(37)-N6)-dimethylallyltransferase MiaA [Patescibacteria group bacterium]
MTHSSQLISPLVVIVGETGGGKSALAMELGKRFNGEIISADSWQVYKGFDIGTAKPTLSDQKAVKHHLIDIVKASDGFNAAQYQKLALLAINNIQARSRLPIMVGGTGLYIDSVLYDFGFLPAVDAAERSMRDNKTIDELLTEAETTGISMKGIDIHNKRRIIRALEAQGQIPTSKPLRSNTLLMGVRLPLVGLKKKITERVETMLQNGLTSEVSGLAQKYGWDAEPMKGIGYREWELYFAGVQNLDETKQKIIKSTMDLAKRQRTWFKRNNSIQWLDYPLDAVEIVTTFLNKKQ